MLLNIINTNFQKKSKLIKFLSKLDLNTNLANELFLNGCYVNKNAIPTELITKICKRYFIKKGNFISVNKNLSFPILDPAFLEFISSTNFNSIINNYFQTLYDSLPILQIFPAIVITNPQINQNQYRSDDENINIPGGLHIDYPTEFTIHIPLVEINEKTPHTVYVNKSCTNIFFNELIIRIGNTKLKNKLLQIAKINTVPLFASPGDLIMLDVTGLHRAEIKPAFRAFIQLKYTCGNDKLINLERRKNFIDSIEYLKLNFTSYPDYRSELQKDLMNLSTLRLNDQYSIIQESIGTYKAF